MSQRKLLQEIDKVFKKVKEGLEIFDGYYEKLQGCENQSQKEKLESDLKREIKKLQRQRDQIKNWLSGNEVKDKKQLLENRKLIENAMERFKVVEKNMKTKAFSKEGLSMERIDPKEKEKNESSDFLHSQIEELERQNEKHEANIDQVQSSVKKGKKLDNGKQNEVDLLQEKIDRNHWHQEKLEQMLRLLANDDIDCEQVNGLQEDIKYYVESNEDADFLEDEGIYDELGLEEVEEAYGNVGDYLQHTDDGMMSGGDSASASNTPRKGSVGLPSTTNLTPVVPTVTQQQQQQQVQPLSSVNKPMISTPVQEKPMISPFHNGSNSNLSNITNNNNAGSTNLKPAVAQKPELKYSSVVSASVQSNQNTPRQGVAQLATTNSNGQLNSNPTVASIPVEMSNQSSESFGLSEDVNKSEGLDSIQSDNDDDDDDYSFNKEIQSLLSSFDKVKQSIQRPQPFEDISKILENSLLNCPDSLDSDKPRYYKPKTSHPTSVFYPQEPILELNYSTIINKLDLSTLFYNFYYNQGDYIQILSARELVKKGWMFDKNSKKWVLKIEEPSSPSLNEINVKPQMQVVWKYFDNEGVWLPRRKDDFDVESVQLEIIF